MGLLVLLIAIFILTISVLVVLYLTDRRFLKKDLKQVLSPEMRKGVNLPTDTDLFAKGFETTRQKGSASKQVLKEVNKK